MTDMYEEMLKALGQGGTLTAATIISRTGSTPVPAGARMILRGDGGIPLGTVGGGCIEADVIEEARKPWRDGASCRVRSFTLTEDDIESGMLCGGRVDILIERVVAGQAPLYAEVVSRRDAGRDSAVLTVLDTAPAIRGKFLVPLDEGELTAARLAAVHHASALPPLFEEDLRRAVAARAVTRVPLPSGEIIIEPVIGPQDLIIFGGGHVSRYVSRSAAMAGFRVTVIDERPDYANPERFPEAYRTLAMGFDASWSALEVRPSASIVIVTRGHKFDERVLERAIQTPARYVGMIGSRRKVLATFLNIADRGVPAERLHTVRAPIGLDIGAETAEEIGISITAELIAVRRGMHPPIGAMADGVTEAFEAAMAGRRSGATGEDTNA